MQIIGINGFKRSGKGTVALAVVSLLDDKNVLSVGFADKLKVMGALALGWRGTQQELIDLMDVFKEHGRVDSGLDGPEIDYLLLSHGITGREYLQNFGNQARNLFGLTFWIDQVLPDLYVDHGAPLADVLATRYPDVDVLCLTDLRYPNEAERIKALGGVVWEVIRPGLESDGHASEQPLPRGLVDHQIINDAGVVELEERVEDALAETC